jgi:hypothetical protein
MAWRLCVSEHRLELWKRLALREAYEASFTKNVAMIDPEECLISKRSVAVEMDGSHSLVPSVGDVCKVLDFDATKLKSMHVVDVAGNCQLVMYVQNFFNEPLPWCAGFQWGNRIVVGRAMVAKFRVAKHSERSMFVMMSLSNADRQLLQREVWFLNAEQVRHRMCGGAPTCANCKRMSP